MRELRGKRADKHKEVEDFGNGCLVDNNTAGQAGVAGSVVSAVVGVLSETARSLRERRHRLGYQA